MCSSLVYFRMNCSSLIKIDLSYFNCNLMFSELVTLSIIVVKLYLSIIWLLILVKVVRPKRF